MGEKWWPNGAWDMHPGFFYMPQILPKEGVLRIFLSPFKNPTASAGFEPANLGIRGQHATSAPPKPLWRCNHYIWCKRNVIKYFNKSKHALRCIV